MPSSARWCWECRSHRDCKGVCVTGARPGLRAPVGSVAAGTEGVERPRPGPAGVWVGFPRDLRLLAGPLAESIMFRPGCPTWGSRPVGSRPSPHRLTPNHPPSLHEAPSQRAHPRPPPWASIAFPSARAGPGLGLPAPGSFPLAKVPKGRWARLRGRSPGTGGAVGVTRAGWGEAPPPTRPLWASAPPLASTSQGPSPLARPGCLLARPFVPK